MQSQVPNENTVAPSAEVEAEQAPPSRDFNTLWLLLTLRGLHSIVFVPADKGESAVEAATSLAEAGQWLRDGKVALFVMWGALDYASAVRSVKDVSREGSLSPNSSHRVITAIPSVLTEPLGIGVARAADAVVLCVRMGCSHLSAIQRTVELIGRDRIVGCLLLK